MNQDQTGLSFYVRIRGQSEKLFVRNRNAIIEANLAMYYTVRRKSIRSNLSIRESNVHKMRARNDSIILNDVIPYKIRTQDLILSGIKRSIFVNFCQFCDKSNLQAISFENQQN